MQKLTPLLYVAYWALAIFQLWAFAEGVGVWLHWGFFGAVFVFIVLSIIPFGNIGIAVVAFIGATKGWGWEWWQAILLVAPFAVLGIALQITSYAAARLSRRRSAPY